MDESNQLEDGEIEDISDKEIQMIEEISDAEEEKPIANAELQSRNVIKQQHNRSSHSFLSWKKYSTMKKQGIFSSKNLKMDISFRIILQVN